MVRRFNKLRKDDDHSQKIVFCCDLIFGLLTTSNHSGLQEGES